MKISVVVWSTILSLALSFLTGFLPRAFAQESAISTVYPKISKGDVMLGGSLGFAYSTYSRLSFELNPTVEYFVADRFSLGGTIGFTISDSHTYYLIGPSATYYFWRDENLTANVGAELRTGAYNWAEGRSGFSSGRFRLGLNYFLSPEVSIGPLLTLDKGFGDGAGASAIDHSTLKVQFQIHL